jgi:hypothetical protein
MLIRYARLFALICVFVMSIGAVTAANATQTYGFTTVATTNATSGEGLSLPSINDSGTVAFVNTTSGTDGLYTGNGGALTTVDSGFNKFYIYYAGGPGAPTINDAGTVAAWEHVGAPGSLSTVDGIMAYQGGNALSIVSSTPPAGSNSGNYTETPTISTGGTVAFAFRAAVASAGGGIFTGNGGSLTTLIYNSAADSNADPSISHNGLVAYDWPGLISGTSFRNGNDSLYLVNGNTTTNVGTVTSDLFTSVAVNNSGTVVASTGREIYTTSGGNLTGVVNTLGALSGFGTVAINDAGEYAYFAALGAGGSEILTGPDPVQDKVVETGDPLDGSTITELGFAGEGLNDSGQITFWAMLGNGQQGIFIATVPEPSSASISLVLAGALLLMRSPLRQRVSR